MYYICNQNIILSSGSVKYNSAAGSGSGRKEAVKIRDEEIKHSWENFLLKGTESAKQDNVA